MVRNLHAAVFLASSVAAGAASAVGPAETSELTFGFIKLTDMAPLAIACENGYFEQEGLDVHLEALQSWNQAIDGVVSGTLDGAHMLAGQPLAARIGYGDTHGDVVVPLSLDLNGNAITVSNEVWEKMASLLAGRGRHSPRLLRPG